MNTKAFKKTSEKITDSIFLQGAVTNLSVFCHRRLCDDCPLGDDPCNCIYTKLSNIKNELLREIERF